MKRLSTEEYYADKKPSGWSNYKVTFRGATSIMTQTGIVHAENEQMARQLFCSRNVVRTIYSVEKI